MNEIEIGEKFVTVIFHFSSQSYMIVEFDETYFVNTNNVQESPNWTFEMNPRNILSY